MSVASKPGTLDIEKIRADFPILRQRPHGKPLVYLDNAATTQKPQCVVDAIENFYLKDCSNVHRGVHELSMRATDAYEGARRRIGKFINASSHREVVFVRGATEGINLVAQSLARAELEPGDEVLVTHMEHHSNIVPWQLVCQQTGAILRVIPIDDAGDLVLDSLDELLTERTKIVAIVHVSNALGTVNPVKEIAARAHAVGARVLVDGAQAAPHLAIDVQDLGVDFYAISAHKMYGPTGIGVLWGREEWLERMEPWQGGGDMIASVSFDGTTYNELPYKFEAGTPHIAGGIGMGAAADFLQRIGLERIGRHEELLLAHATRTLGAIEGVRPIGTARHKAAVYGFVLEGVHAHDVGTILDEEGIAVRTGHHCAQPVMDRYGVPATARASFGVYNTIEEIDRLAVALARVREIFA
jgi:cysteine desulfurase/selenocysteine lyase